MKGLIAVFVFFIILISLAEGKLNQGPMNSRQIEIPCTESDDGKDFYLRGSVWGVDNWGINGIISDICLGKDELVPMFPGQRRVIETSRGTAMEIRLLGLDEGKGKVLVSLDGKEFTAEQWDKLAFAGGYVGINQIAENWVFLTFNLTAAGNKLLEYYCEDQKIGFEIYECPMGCSDGACRVDEKQERTTKEVVLFPLEHFLQINPSEFYDSWAAMGAGIG